MAKKRWSELTPVRRKTFIGLSCLQVALAAAAWTDLAMRPGEFVRGSRAWWALAILVNFAGPFACFRWGRRA